VLLTASFFLFLWRDPRALSEGNIPCLYPQVCADRIVGNHVEWMPMFLVLFWVNLVLTNTGILAGMREWA
jgi:hypothetical protein